MLSRREKLLVQPWEDRRFKDHRQKATLTQEEKPPAHIHTRLVPGYSDEPPQVQRARAAVDAAAPAPRAHVALKLKKWQRERERRDKLRADNFSLLQRLARVMAVNRLENHWVRPLPDFHQKVGQFYDSANLRHRISERARVEPEASPQAHVKCYACEYRKTKNNTMTSFEDNFRLPSII